MHIKHVTHLETPDAHKQKGHGTTKTASVTGLLPDNSKNTETNYGPLSHSTFASTITLNLFPPPLNSLSERKKGNYDVKQITEMRNKKRNSAD